jgi:deoxyribodipyrimidine photo-lyase
MILVWLRQDLRVLDNPALYEASLSGEEIRIVYGLGADSDLGGASKWWLHHSLQALNQDLKAHYGIEIDFFQESPRSWFESVLKAHKVSAIYWNRCYEPEVIARDTELKSWLQEQGVLVRSFNSALIREPWELKTQQGKPYQVYSPFWRAWRAGLQDFEVLPRPTPFRVAKSKLSNLHLDDFGLLDPIPWAKLFPKHWSPGEAQALKGVETCVSELSAARYADLRNFPAQPGTSRLSPHLHFGEVSVRDLWKKMSQAKGGESKNEVFLKELVWREFAYHLIYHFPHTARRALRPEYDKFPWAPRPDWFRAWTRGQTGYPIVDAGMRQLWATGWMHNRVRMIVSSFLVKHLRQPWLDGAQWFWDTLVDADLAANSMGWQWSAGSGADAAPYFRIFNPVLQGEKFDPEGDYVKAWVPELSRVPPKFIHKPWELSPIEQQSMDLRLGENYPHPIVDHAQARAEALRSLEEFRRISKG